FDHRFEQRLHRVAEFAHGHDAGHARAALERVQVALHADQVFAFARRFAQGREQAVGMVEQVAAFLDEDVDEFGVEVGEVERFVRVLRAFHGVGEELRDFGFDVRFGFGVCFGLGLRGEGLRRFQRGTFARLALGFVFGFEARVFGVFLGGGAFGFGAFGFGAFGFGAFGFGAFGFGAFGFGAFGFDAFGFGAFGFGAFGFGAFGFEAFGFEAFGFGEFGFATFCFEEFGFEAFGFAAFGFEPFGFEAFGFGAFGFGAFGFGALGFDAFGFDAFGFEQR